MRDEVDEKFKMVHTALADLDQEIAVQRKLYSQEVERLQDPGVGPTKADHKITVAGVTFGPEQVKSAVLNIDGREIHIGETKKERQVGFANQSAE